MEEPVPECIDLKISNIVRRVACAGEHLMPLKHLMENNPIEETTQTQPEEETCRGREASSTVFLCLIHHLPTFLWV
jgi:hypothetical protein